MLYRTYIDVFPYFLVPVILFWLWMLYDCFVHERSSRTMLFWLIIIFFTQFIGALLYFFVRRPERLKME
jgi:hypothetical protein